MPLSQSRNLLTYACLPASPPLRVALNCVTVKGERGGHGIFHQYDVLHKWDTGDGRPDHPDATEIKRLLDLGFIEPA